jgi:hypothetical protein
MACRLVALNKQPGFHPVGIGESFCRLMAKYLLGEIGHLATTTCGIRNICAGLPAGIEGAVHAIRKEYSSAATQPTVGAVANRAGTAANDKLSDEAPDDLPDLLP